MKNRPEILKELHQYQFKNHCQRNIPISLVENSVLFLYEKIEKLENKIQELENKIHELKHTKVDKQLRIDFDV